MPNAEEKTKSDCVSIYAYPTIEDWAEYAPAGMILSERDRIIWDMARTTNAMLGILDGSD